MEKILQSWIETVDVAVSSQGQSIDVRIKTPQDVKALVGIAVNATGSGDIVNFKMNNRQYLGNRVDAAVLAIDPTNDPNNRFYKFTPKDQNGNDAGIPTDPDRDLQFTYTDTTTSGFSSYTRRIYLLYQLER